MDHNTGMFFSILEEAHFSQSPPLCVHAGLVSGLRHLVIWYLQLKEEGVGWSVDHSPFYTMAVISL